MRNTELLSKHPKHKKRRQSSPLEMSEGEVSGDSEERRSIDLKRSLSGDSDSSSERVKKHKKKRKKHRRKHKHSESECEANSDAESHTKTSKSPEFMEHSIQRIHPKDRDDDERRRRNYEEDKRRDRPRDDFQESYELVKIKQEPVYEDNRARHYNVPSRQRHSESRHRERSEAEHQPRRHHRREGDQHQPRREGGKSHRYHDDRPAYRERRHSDERERSHQPARGRPARGGGRQGSTSRWRDEQEPKFDPSRAIKQERQSPAPEPGPEPGTFEWGKKGDNVKEEKGAPGDKEKPNFGLSGKLAEETNTFKGVVIKYSEPPEARKPRRRWRFYPFKGEKALQTLYIHRQSSYLLGRDRKIADIPIDHPSCSKQHAALQYRLVGFKREDGSSGKRVRPYIVDLESANGTFVNNRKIEARKYVELLEKDVVKFGFSSREYVLLHEHSKDDDYEDVGEVEAEGGGETQDPDPAPAPE